MSTLQVDRIIPYQSSSVLVEGLSAPNLATTGSNTFTGNQNIQGTITYMKATIYLQPKWGLIITRCSLIFICQLH
jgi:hypothetical protein